MGIYYYIERVFYCQDKNQRQNMSTPFPITPIRLILRLRPQAIQVTGGAGNGGDLGPPVKVGGMVGAQVKTDRVDSEKLAQLLRADLILEVRDAGQYRYRYSIGHTGVNTGSGQSRLQQYC